MHFDVSYPKNLETSLKIVGSPAQTKLKMWSRYIISLTRNYKSWILESNESHFGDCFTICAIFTWQNTPAALFYNAVTEKTCICLKLKDWSNRQQFHIFKRVPALVTSSRSSHLKILICSTFHLLFFFLYSLATFQVKVHHIIIGQVLFVVVFQHRLALRVLLFSWY